ncbi:MAG: alpha-L-fucosidase [Bacteroidales bacterium]
MRHKKVFLNLLMVLFSIFIVQGAIPTTKGFKKLNLIYSDAIKSLNEVTSHAQLPKAMTQLKKLEKKCENDPSIIAVLKSDLQSCPEKLKPTYLQSLKLQSDLKDAAKRLAMGGILQSDQYGVDFNNFMNKIKLSDDSIQEQPLLEGAPYESKEDRDKRMKWWRDGKFGMFIHYGLYSGLGGEVKGKKYEGCVEWIQMQSGLDSESYAAEAIDKFTPKSGKAAEWVKLAKEAGCTYTVLTTRHHEGYNMFDTKFTDFNVKKTKGIDIVEEYSHACKEEGIKAGYYVSLLDWSHPDYDPSNSGISYPKGNYDAQTQGKRQFGNHKKYKEYLLNIFDELTTNYPVDLVWWDFSQPNFQGDHAWGATKLMHTLFNKNPNAIQNNRLYHSDNHLSEGGIKVTPTWKGDYSTAEHHVPATGIDGDWETCQTLNGTWGYSADNQKWKSSEDLIHELIDVVSRGGNFLLNIGPEPDGSIPAESVRIFKEIGSWMDKNNEAIYGTRANPFDVEFEWGRVTRKGDDLTYLFVYDKPENNTLSIPCLFDNNIEASLLDGGDKIKVTQDNINKKSSFNIADITLQKGATVIKVTGKRK